MTCESFLTQFTAGCNSFFVSTNPWAFVYLSIVLAPLALAAVVGVERGVRWLFRRYIAWRDAREFKRWCREMETEERMRRGLKAADRYGWLKELFP